MNADTLIECSNLTLGYDRHPAVHHLSLRIPRGDLLAVVGPNGAGKSTLLKGLVGELKPLEGSLVSQVDPKRLAYLPQQAQLERDLPISVFDVVATGLWQQRGAFRSLLGRWSGRVRQALETVGLFGFERRPIGTLSGGQFQRMLFARLMLQDAELILLDEPFTAVDSRTTADLLGLIQRWHDEGRTVLAVTHDLEQVRAHCPRCALLARELIAAGPTAEVLSKANLERALQIHEAFDERAHACHRGEAA